MEESPCLSCIYARKGITEKITCSFGVPIYGTIYTCAAYRRNYWLDIVKQHAKEYEKEIKEIISKE